MLEEGPASFEIGCQVGVAVPLEPGGEDQVVSPLKHIDRVDLHISEAVDEAPDRCRRGSAGRPGELLQRKKKSGRIAGGYRVA